MLPNENVENVFLDELYSMLKGEESFLEENEEGSLFESETSLFKEPLPVIYNQYLRCARDPLYATGSEALQMLLRPLFTTSFLLDDFLADNDFFGAETLVISSVSSKTGLGVAWCAHRREHIRVVGLTAAANLDFVAERNVCDDVIAYGAEDTMPAGPAVYVDVSGSAAVRNAVHRHFGDALVHDMVLGATHLGDLGRADDDLPGAKPAFFFAPPS